MWCLVAFIFLDCLVCLLVFWSGEKSINKCFLVLLLMKPLSTSNISAIPYKMKSGSHDNRCDAISMGEDCIKILLDYNIKKTSPFHFQSQNCEESICYLLSLFSFNLYFLFPLVSLSCQWKLELLLPLELS